VGSEASAKQTFVRLERRPDGIAVLILANLPLNLNTHTTLEQLLAACDLIAADRSIRVVVVTGEGDRAFCAGSDIRELAEVLDDVVVKKLQRENEAFTALERLPQPVIAAMQGPALGGGAEISLACDLRIIDADARIGFPEINLGVFPGSGGVFRLPRLVGSANAYQLLYSGEPIDAQEALRIGLVNQIAPPGECLQRALQIASRLATKSALALSLIRAGVRDSFSQSTDEAIRRTLVDSYKVFTADDAREGIDAFFAKRVPRFTA
jgi:enoyl-CoA hydratase